MDGSSDRSRSAVVDGHALANQSSIIERTLSSEIGFYDQQSFHRTSFLAQLAIKLRVHATVPGLNRNKSCLYIKSRQF